MRLYYGSRTKVETPRIELCRPGNDYGVGFYCTPDKKLAMEWACKKPGENGYCNEYLFDDSELNIIDLDESPHGVYSWLAVLMENRQFDAEWNVANLKTRFIEMFHVDLSDADVVCGYRADDSYFSIARAFVQGAITDLQLERALRLGDLGRQVMVRSKRAFDALSFVRAHPAKATEWYPRWTARDRQARQAFRDLVSQDGPRAGRRIFEIVEERP